METNRIDNNVLPEKQETHSNETKFYTNAQQYWSTVPATVDGMLGGFGIIHMVDVKGSQKFFNDIFKLIPLLKKTYALDCGSGIGRVTKNLLMPIFNKVDMVEQDSNFTRTASHYVGEQNVKLGKIFNVGLQEFEPEASKYDVIWCQWVLGHLTDDDLKMYLQRMKLGLNKNGVLILKENVTSSEKVEIDETDSSVTRPLKTYKKLLKQTNYRVIKIVRQTNFPKGLYSVFLIAAVPN